MCSWNVFIEMALKLSQAIYALTLFTSSFSSTTEPQSKNTNLTYLTKMAANQERTFIMIKPDGVHRGLVGEIIKRFEQKGFKLVAMKFTQVRF